MAKRSPLQLPQLLVLLSVLSSCVMATDTASSTVESIFNSAEDGVKAGGSIIAILAIVVGLFVCFAGYRYFRHALFVCGFVGGGVLIATIVEHSFDDKSWMTTASWIGFVVGGLVIGSIVAALYELGIFAAGAAGGVFLAIALNTSIGYKIYPSNPNVVLIILMVILGILAGVLALKLEKPVLIVTTSLFGAGVLVWGAGYFAGDYPNADDLKHYRSQSSNGDWVYDIPSAWWAYLAAMAVLFIVGMLVQFNKTGRDQQYHRLAKSRAEPAPQYVEATTPQYHQGNVRYGDPVRLV